MKFINIDAEFMIENGLTLEQASFFCYLRESLSWADDVVFDNKPYKWVSRKKVVSDIPYITDKTDTVYRWLVSMSKLGLIEYVKSGNKDLFRMTEKSKKWNTYTSDRNPNNTKNSDRHPTKLGSPSESNSDHHPTDSNINIYSNNIDSNNSDSDVLINLFELFRKKYQGTKRGLSTELSVLKKHKDWKEVVNELSSILDRQTKERGLRQAKGEFVPQWPNLQTYLNQRRWEEEVKIETPTGNRIPKQERNNVMQGTILTAYVPK